MAAMVVMSPVNSSWLLGGTVLLNFVCETCEKKLNGERDIKGECSENKISRNNSVW